MSDTRMKAVGFLVHNDLLDVVEIGMANTANKGLKLNIVFEYDLHLKWLSYWTIDPIAKLVKYAAIGETDGV